MSVRTVYKRWCHRASGQTKRFYLCFETEIKSEPTMKKKPTDLWKVAFGVSLIIFLVGPSALLAETLDLILSPNTTTKVDVPKGVRKVYISNPTIIDAEPEEDGFSIVVTGLTSGDAELRISQVSGVDIVYKVQVQPELQDLAEEVRELLEDVEGVDVRILGENIILAGELFTRGGAKRVAEITKNFDGVVVNMTELDLSSYNRNVEKAIAKQIGHDTVDVEVKGERIVITGSVPSQGELERVKDIAEKFDLKSTIMLMVQ